MRCTVRAFKESWMLRHWKGKKNKTIKQRADLVSANRGRLCCRRDGKLSIRPCLDVQYLIQKPAMNEYIKSCRPDACSMWWHTLCGRSRSLFRWLEQVKGSELERQSEQKRGSRGDARAGMGSCCCSCLSRGLGTELADHGTEVAAELQPRNLETEKETGTR